MGEKVYTSLKYINTVDVEYSKYVIANYCFVKKKKKNYHHFSTEIYLPILHIIK